MGLSVVKRSAELSTISNAIAGQLEASSIRQYRSTFAQFEEFVGGVHLWEVTRDQIIAYRAELMTRYKLTTAQHKFAVVKRIFSEALAHLDFKDRFASDPTFRVRGIKAHDEEGVSKHIALEKEQARALINAAESDRDRLILILLLRSGMRRSEIVKFRPNMIQQEGAFYKVVIEGKGRKRRAIVLVDDVRDDIEQFVEKYQIAPDAPIFQPSTRNHITTGRDDVSLSDDRIYEIVRSAGAKIGLPNLTAHSMRATFATVAFEAEAPLERIQEAMGHSDSRTTRRYHKRRESLKNSAFGYVRY